ncbi:hypothetical protein RCC89_12065 [Cytophagaceae bacterium ABcell3]|nr:hypothetical protein RCC89_12065 [Cytophagaceae bacterium ABcell3]
MRRILKGLLIGKLLSSSGGRGGCGCLTLLIIAAIVYFLFGNFTFL